MLQSAEEISTNLLNRFVEKLETTPYYLMDAPENAPYICRLRLILDELEEVGDLSVTDSVLEDIETDYSVSFWRRYHIPGAYRFEIAGIGEEFAAVNIDSVDEQPTFDGKTDDTELAKDALQDFFGKDFYLERDFINEFFPSGKNLSLEERLKVVKGVEKDIAAMPTTDETFQIYETKMTPRLSALYKDSLCAACEEYKDYLVKEIAIANVDMSIAEEENDVDYSKI